MISHEHALTLYDAYFAGQLDRETVRAFHSHLNDCADCKVRLRTLNAAGPGAGFTRLGKAGSPDLEARRQELLRRNRVIMMAVLAVMICFFFFFKLKRG